MTYRMIAIDLDGTLLQPGGHVSDRTKAAIHKCLDAGLLVCFATGRNYTESRTVLDAVEHYDTAVFVGGAMVIDTRHGRTVHRTLMDPALARELCAFIESHGHAALVLQDTSGHGIDYLISEHLPLNESLRHWLDLTAATVHFASDLTTASHERTVRVSTVAPGDVVAQIKAGLAEKFGPRIVYHAVQVAAYGVEVLETFDPAVNKWEGILHVARSHKIDPAEIIAIGDDVNDVPMLRHAGLGVAMGNAKPEALAVAKQVIGRNTDEGLAAFLEELVERHRVEPLNDE